MNVRTDMIEPMRKTAMRFVRTPMIYKKGIVKMLSESIPPRLPLFPNNTTGKEIIHANITALHAMSDHVKAAVITISQIQHTIIPAIMIAEKITDAAAFF